MNYIKRILIGIVLIIPLSVDCQDSLICIERSVIEKVANKLDSFDILKLEKQKYVQYKKFSDSLINAQLVVINLQDMVVVNKDKEISSFERIDNQNKLIIDTNVNFNKYLRKENSRLKVRNKVYLIGGGVLSIGLTAALLISLF